MATFCTELVLMVLSLHPTRRHLIVSDRGDLCIKVFNREGEFLHKFGKKGKEDGYFHLKDILYLKEREDGTVG